MEIYKQMPKIMAEVDPIAKGRKNTQQNYQFRGIDDVYQHLQMVLAKHGVFTTSEILADHTEDRQSSKGSALIYRVLKIRFYFNASDGSKVFSDVIGEGMDSGDKASNKAMSVAHKYALLQAFCIPTDEPKDPENDSHDVKPIERKQNESEPEKNDGCVIYKGTMDQRQIVKEKLKKNGVPEKDWQSIHDEMINKPTTYLITILARYA